MINLAELSDEFAKDFNIENHKGYVGTFTTDNAIGAIPRGARIEKYKSESEDLMPIGSTGTVLGSFKAGDMPIMYFVEWDKRPKISVLVNENKIKMLEK